MSHHHLQSSPAPKARMSALLTAFACAGVAWAIGAGSVLAPEPADLTTSLTGSTGATAAAVRNQYIPSTYPLWPDTWRAGTLAAGTPCSTYGLPPGSRTTKRIFAIGPLRRCSEYNPLLAPEENFIRPLPPMPIDSSDKSKSTGALEVTTVDIVSVISWPADWFRIDEGYEGTTPYVGQPCSDFALYAGESTYKHIQGVNINNNAVFRCVANTEPLYND